MVAIGECRLQPACATQWAVDTPTVRLGHWACRSQYASGRQQPWSMISFCHKGAYAIAADHTDGVIDANTVLFFSPNQPYETRPITRGLSYGTSIALLPEIVEQAFPGSIGSGNHSFVLSRVLDPRIRMKEAQLFAALNDPILVANVGLEELAIEVFMAAARACGSRSPSMCRVVPRKSAEYVDAVKSILAVRFRHRVGLAELASATGLSPFHLCRLFASETGVSIHRYLISLRLSVALEYLAEPNCNLADLAHALGFAQHSHFTASFRRRFGVTPSAARNHLRPHSALTDMEPVTARRRRGS